jgi:hypothetical protein
MQIPRFVRYCSFALLILVIPAWSFAGVFVSVTIAPPALPVYTQPACPGDGYIWTPGYWAYGLIRKATNCRLPGRYNDWEKVRSGGAADVCIYGDVPLIQ